MPEDEQDLPADVALMLAPHLRHALSSPPRRRILRALNGATEAQTIEDLGETIPAASASTLNYHVLILEKEGCVSEVCQIVRVNEIVRAYASNIADNRTVIEALRTTRWADEGLAT